MKKLWLTFFLISCTNDKAKEQPNLEKWSDEFEVVEIKSPIDGETQKAYFYKTTSSEPQPLIVSLHTWSFDYTQYDSINIQSVEKDLNYIHPDFRGPNKSKDACCSDLVISDIDAAIDFAINLICLV